MSGRGYLTTESTQALEAGVAPFEMQKRYDAKMLQDKQMAQSMSQWGNPGNPGSQITIPTQQQLNMTEQQRRVSAQAQAAKNAQIAQDSAAQRAYYNSPEYKEQSRLNELKLQQELDAIPPRKTNWFGF